MGSAECRQEVGFGEFLQDKLLGPGIIQMPQVIRRGVGRILFRVLLQCIKHQIRLLYPFSGAEKDRPVDRILQFTHIPAPWTVKEDLQGLFGEFQFRSIILLAIFFQKMMDQQRDIGLNLPEAGQGYGHHIQAIKEILTEFSPGNFCLDILIGGGHHPDIHHGGLCLAQRLDLFLLQDRRSLV